MEELKKLSAQLLKLETHHNWQTADETCNLIASIFGINVERFKLWHDPRIVAEATRFMTAFETVNNPAAYEARHSSEKAIDIKLYWMKKSSKTNLSWIAGAADNFEDSTTMQHKKVGIDLVVPEACDRVFIIVSNQYKLRVLELHNHLSITDQEILKNVTKIKDHSVLSVDEKTAYHTVIWDAFNFEPINRKFYLELVDRFVVLRDHLILQKNISSSESVLFTARMIGRLLFVKFLYKKNLINPDFEYFNAPAGGSKIQTVYYQEKLETLFFRILNTPIEDRRRYSDDKINLFGKVKKDINLFTSDAVTPYLNGGLFADLDSDFYNKGVITFPENYFSDFQSILSKYNFTVDESSPEFQQVAVDPEMLGRIFESLLAEQIDDKTGNSKKKATGAFYTPREIVSYMCEQSLIEYLKTKVPETPDRDRRIEELVHMPEAIFRDQDQNKRRDWKPYRESIINALEGSKTESPLTVLDPAVGSGAFPMGMLHLLVKVYSRLDSKFEKDISGLKRDILSRSLYGVDIEQTAIEITRLRAWLSIIVDIPEGEKIEPLPNLEFKFVCANTLIPLDNTEQSTFTTDSNLKDKLIAIRGEYFKTSSKAKKEKLQKEYLKNTSQDSFFDNKKTQQLKSYKPFDISSSSEFYDPELMHGVQAFDIVIGNPPYVNVEKIDKSIKNNIQLFKTAYQKYDLYVLFYEKGLALLKNKGILNYITSNKFLSQGYGLLLRQEFLKYSVQKIINFNYDIFDSATVRTCVFQLLKSIATDDHLIKIINIETENDAGKFETESYENIKQSIFKEIEENNFRINLTDDKLKILNKIKINTLKVEEICSVNYGIRPSSEKLGLKKESFIHEDNKENKFKEYFEGKDMGYWSVKDTSFIDYRPDVMYNPMFVELFENEKLVGLRTLSDIRKLRFIYDNTGLYCNDSVVVLTLWHKFKDVEYQTIKRLITKEKINISNKYNLKYLQSILNSKLIKFYVNEMLYDGTHFYPNHMKQLPIKKLNEFDQKPFINLVDQILTLKKQNKDADTKKLEDEIDQLVYKLYDISPEEIEMVENSSKK